MVVAREGEGGLRPAGKLGPRERRCVRRLCGERVHGAVDLPKHEG
eukprot:COSAG01_NODE_693_length_14202_cov_11.739491_10_plen_45_part_00